MLEVGQLWQRHFLGSPTSIWLPMKSYDLQCMEFMSGFVFVWIILIFSVLVIVSFGISSANWGILAVNAFVEFRKPSKRSWHSFEITWMLWCYDMLYVIWACYVAMRTKSSLLWLSEVVYTSFAFSNFLTYINTQQIKKSTMISSVATSISWSMAHFPTNYSRDALHCPRNSPTTAWCMRKGRNFSQSSIFVYICIVFTALG